MCVCVLKNYSLLSIQQIPGFVLSMCISCLSKEEGVSKDRSFFVGPVLCTIGHLTTSLSLPPRCQEHCLSPSGTTKNVSRPLQCPMGGKYQAFENHCPKGK